MKKSSFFISILLCVLFSAAALCAINVTGKWSGTLQMEGETDSKPAYLILKQEGNKLAGSAGDRKSTRLNSSHRCISYAVFCLKKKKLHPVDMVMLQDPHDSTSRHS